MYFLNFNTRNKFGVYTKEIYWHSVIVNKKGSAYLGYSLYKVS